jgi:PIN domain nuclease of toxin-antitoxin system
LTTYVLDAGAVVALFNDEKGADVVDSLFVEAASDLCNLVMNKYNLLEVYYGYLRNDGLAIAEKQLAAACGSRIRISDTLTDDLMRKAGNIKASFKMSLADSVLLAQALVDDGVVVTTDHHELDAVDKSGAVRILWVR